MDFMRSHPTRAGLSLHGNFLIRNVKGCGKLEKNNRRVQPLKNILIYPLQKNFLAILAG